MAAGEAAGAAGVRLDVSGLLADLEAGSGHHHDGTVDRGGRVNDDDDAAPYVDHNDHDGDDDHDEEDGNKETGTEATRRAAAVAMRGPWDAAALAASAAQRRPPKVTFSAAQALGLLACLLPPPLPIAADATGQGASVGARVAVQVRLYGPLSYPVRPL